MQPAGERDLAGIRTRSRFHPAPRPDGAAALSRDEDSHTLRRLARRVRLGEFDLRRSQQPKPLDRASEVE